MTSTNIYCVYKITNTNNGKIYIGMSGKTAAQRFERHIVSSKVKRWSHLKLYRAILKYGVDSFEVETIYQSSSFENICTQEAKFIAEYNSMDDSIGYNMAPGGRGGDIKSKEQKQKNAEISRELNKKKIVCDHCGRGVDRRNFARWHGENCLSNPNVILSNRQQPPVTENTKINQSIAQLKLKKKLSPELKATIGKQSSDRIKNMSPEELSSKMQNMRSTRKCQYCGKEMTSGNYSRWHGENCKFKQ
jgi:group I intron endonuclease